MKIQLKKTVLGIGIFCLILGGFAISTRLLESVSESLEGVRYLLVLKSASLKRGDIVSIQGHAPQYVGAHIFTKRIVGLPGDQIIRDNIQPHQLYQLTLKAQNGAYSLILPLLTKTTEGQPLTPLSVSVIPKDHFFVMGDHPRSFDSRYEEFGLISKDKIWGKGVLTW